MVERMERGMVQDKEVMESKTVQQKDRMERMESKVVQENERMERMEREMVQEKESMKMERIKGQVESFIPMCAFSSG